MFNSNIFLSVIVLGCIGNVYGKQCSDCVTFSSCPKAAELAINNHDESSKNKFMDSFCGFEYLKLKRIYKVCCSDFTISSRTGEVGPAEEKDTIETHPNAKLLPSNCGDIDGNRIYGGSIAGIYEFPWMALISYKTIEGLQFLCGGSIINTRYILTAGHCVTADKKIAGVRLGEFDINYKTDCQGEYPHFICESHLQDVRVEEVIRHPAYTGLPAPQNDIALLRLKKPIDLNHRNVLPICLPLSQTLRKADVGGSIGTVAGWGLTETGQYSSVLLKVNVSIKTGEQCNNYYDRSSGDEENERSSKYLCAGEYQKDSCNGDSGGPMMLQSNYLGVNRYVQYGIVSYGPVACGSDFPGVYTAVTKFMDWILDNIKE